LTAVAVNEDNKDDQVFTDLAKGKYRICYASPELLLHNPRFKRLFRTEEFRRKVVAIVVDEAHVIEAWKDEFRKDYGELESLKIIAGIEIPWLALTATCSTKTFEVIYQTLGMGGAQPFYGIDLGISLAHCSEVCTKKHVHSIELKMKGHGGLLHPVEAQET
jgi:superfamily II DNA helicase RecQ